MEISEASGEHPRQIGLRIRLISLLGAWAIALIASAVGLERGLDVAQMAPLFPLGWILAVPFVRVPEGDWGLYIISAIGWVPYIALSASALLARKRNAYFVVYSLLCMLLIFNVVGCNELQHTSLKQ
jgi:hypothetical protein